MVIECRRTLKFTYVFGYYIPLPKPGEVNKSKELFEDHQESLERYTEVLSELTEMPIEKMVKADIINNTRVTESFLLNMLQACDDGLEVADLEVAADEMAMAAADANANADLICRPADRGSSSSSKAAAEAK